MNDSGAPRTPHPGHFGIARQEAVHEGAGGLAGSGMHGEARGLVENDEILVGVKDPELAALRLDARIAALRWVPRDLLAGTQQVAGFGLRNSVDRQVAGTDPLLDLVARQVETLGDGPVEANSRLVSFDPPGAGSHGRLRKESSRISTRPIEIALSATLKSGQR